ncbi:MAG: hypothetical protein V1647_04310, partial [Pseudomonadota bacterium]
MKGFKKVFLFLVAGLLFTAFNVSAQTSECDFLKSSISVGANLVNGGCITLKDGSSRLIYVDKVSGQRFQLRARVVSQLTQITDPTTHVVSWTAVPGASILESMTACPPASETFTNGGKRIDRKYNPHNPYNPEDPWSKTDSGFDPATETVDIDAKTGDVTITRTTDNITYPVTLNSDGTFTTDMPEPNFTSRFHFKTIS